jgi:uncharacterized protein (TIGR02996 family)
MSPVGGLMMMHPLQFLHSILACPEDDTPRLQYADWLDGCDNPLGEFIRLQCGLAQAPIRSRHLPGERREQQLLARYQGQWSGDLAGCVEWCSFRRGFIEEVALTEESLIRHADELFRLSPLLDVHLITGGDRLDFLPELPFLQHTIFLDISGQPRGDEGVERLAETPMLAQVHGLNLGSCHVGDAGLDALIESPDLGALRELYLNDNPITDESVRRFVMVPLVEQLHLLDMRNTLIGEDARVALKRILGDKCLV